MEAGSLISPAVVISLLMTLCAVIAFWIRLGRWIERVEISMKGEKEARESDAKSMAEITQSIEGLSKQIERLNVLIEVREKDQTKLEGVNENTQKRLDNLITKISKISGSLDGLWITMQRLFPKEVPPRASDRP